MSQPKTRKDLEAAIVARATTDSEFRQKLVDDPHAGVESLIQELAPEVNLREGMEIKVIEEPENAFYLVVPHAPKSKVELSEEDLEAVAGGILEHTWVHDDGDSTTAVY